VLHGRLTLRTPAPLLDLPFSRAGAKEIGIGRLGSGQLALATRKDLGDPALAWRAWALGICTGRRAWRREGGGVRRRSELLGSTGRAAGGHAAKVE
jgi:hypothetical protein